MGSTDPIRTILDVDTGVDDALALLYAAASPEVHLVAATCVTGNVHVTKTTRNTLVVLELAGRADVEVVAGADRPLVQEWAPFTIVHGEDGLGKHVPGEPSGSASPRDAASLIVEEAAAHPGEVQLIATGPMTNVALALEREPRLPSLLRGFALMGGAFASEGNVTPRAEANVWMDPEAAARVFDAWSGAPPERLPRCVGLDVTERVWMTHADIETVCSPAPASPLARLIAESVPHYIDFYAAMRSLDGASMHDPLAVAAVIDPTLCAWTSTRVEVETAGVWTRGETVADLLEVRNRPWATGWARAENAFVALEVDAPRFMSLFVERLRHLVESRA
jgi:purine nucleosidase